MPDEVLLPADVLLPLEVELLWRASRTGAAETAKADSARAMNEVKRILKV